MTRRRVLAVAAILAAAILAAALAVAGCASSSPAPAAPPTASGPELNGQCVPRALPGYPPAVAGDAAYTLVLTNPGSQPVQVSSVAVIFTGQNGQEIGSDDPAQQDFPGDAYPISHFNTILIGAGQSVTVPMETATISGAAGNWSCSLGGWSQ